MNFKGKKSIDMFVTIRLSRDEQDALDDDLQAALTKSTLRATVVQTIRSGRPIIFEKAVCPLEVAQFCVARTTPTRIDIQASHFYRHRKRPCLLPVEKADPHPHLYCTKVHGHLSYYNSRYFSAEYVNRLFQASNWYFVQMTPDACFITGCIIGCIRKGKEQYYVPTESLKPMLWRPEPNTFTQQNRYTQKVQAYHRKLCMTKEHNKETVLFIDEFHQIVQCDQT